MVLIAVGSTNPVKAEVTKQGFVSVFNAFKIKEKINVIPIEVDSTVPPQPIGEDVILKGATARAIGAMKLFPTFDYWVGIETGVVEINGYMHEVAWIYVIKGLDNGQVMMSESRATSFRLPKRVSELVANGYEVGLATDLVFEQDNSKQGSGLIGHVSRELLTRTSLYIPAMITAILPFFKPELY